MTLYHGTSVAEWQHIKKEGLVPGRGHGGDYWAGTPEGLGHPMNVGFNRPASVYLTPYKGHAEQFANLAAEVNKSKPVLLKVTLPESANLVPDEADDSAFRYEKTIPAGDITRIVNVKIHGHTALPGIS